MISNILFFIAILAFFILARKKLKLSLQLMLLLLPTYLWRLNFFGLPTTFLEMMILVCFGVWFWQNKTNLIANIKVKIANKKLNNRYPFDIEIALIMLIAFIAIVVSGAHTGAFGIFKAYFFEAVLVFLLIFNVFGEKKEFGCLVWPLFLSSLVISLLAWYQEYVDIAFLNPIWGHASLTRVVSFYDYPNAIGLFLAPITVLGIAWLIKCLSEKRKGERVEQGELMILGSIIFLNLGAIAFAQSEGALVGILVASAFMMLVANKYSRLVLVGLIVLFMFGLKNANFEIFVIEKATLSDLSGEIRKQQWRETKQVLEKSWFFGAGLDGYQTAVKPYHQEGIYFNKEKDPDFYRKIHIFSKEYKSAHWQPVEIYKYPHNIFLNFWSELGVLGLLVFAWLMAKYLTISLKLSKLGGVERWLAIGLGAMMVAQIAHGLVDVPYFKNDLSVLFWVEMAMLSILLVKSRKYIKSVN